MRLLLVEDEPRMAQALCALLRLEKYEVDHFADGNEGLEAIQSRIYDIIILDVMLPGRNGYDITRCAREQGIATPILLLTAKAELDDKVYGLDCGADDYLTKPFMTKELLARLRALSRRTLPLNSEQLTYGDLTLNRDTALLTGTATGQSIRLSDKEFHLLEYLMANGGKILAREQLVTKIWGLACNTEYNNVEVYLSFLRKKLAFVGSKTSIKSVRGLGYEMRCDDV